MPSIPIDFVKTVYILLSLVVLINVVVNIIRYFVNYDGKQLAGVLMTIFGLLVFSIPLAIQETSLKNTPEVCEVYDVVGIQTAGIFGEIQYLEYEKDDEVCRINAKLTKEDVQKLEVKRHNKIVVKRQDNGTVYKETCSIN